MTDIYHIADYNAGLYMSSKVVVDMPICPNHTVIETELNDDGSVRVHIKSTCSHVRDYAKSLTEVGLMDMTSITDSKIMKLAETSHITPTCLVPVSVYNACWLESGMISKTAAKNSPTSTMTFDME